MEAGGRGQPRDGRALATAWYRSTATIGHRRASYLAIVLVVGLLGGLALGSVAAGRRTASSFAAFLASTNPSDLVVAPSGRVGGPLAGYPPKLIEELRALPHVRHVESYVAFQASVVAHGRSEPATQGGKVLVVGSVDGMLFDQDRMTMTSGRRADAGRADEVEVTKTAAAALGLHLGEGLRLLIDSPTGAGPATPVMVRVVGIGVLNREVVEDQIAEYPTYIVGTPALTRSLLPDAALLYYGLQLQGGSRFVADVERAYNEGPGRPYFTDFEVLSQVAQQAQQAIKPEALALGAFGAIAGVATVLLALQGVIRLLDAREEDLLALRALGASPATTVLDGLISILASVVLGALVAVGVAVVLSPLSPIGPVRPVYPGGAFSADWTVLGLGALALVVVLGTAAAVLSFFRAPHRLAGRTERPIPNSPVVALAVRAGLPTPAVVGARFAFERGRGRAAVPVRSALFASGMAIVVVVATLTFGSSLSTLVSHPNLYGWNWDYAVQSADGYGPIPNAVTASLASDPEVTAWSGVWFATLQLDGIQVPALLAYPGAPVGPPITSGHALASRDQIVLGAATLAALHQHLGGSVFLQDGRRPIRLTVAGVATMPAIGIAEGLHTSVAIGAIIPANNGVFTEQLGPQGYPGCNGPNMVLLRVRGGPGPSGLAAADALASRANRVLGNEPAGGVCGGDFASTLGVQRPAQIVDYRAIGDTPLLLAAALALGAAASLGLCLAASVRRRRRQFAVLKTLGLTERELRFAVFWQSTAVAVVGLVVGIPLGIALGRWLWSLFANEIGFVPAPSVPALFVLLSALVAVVLANLVAVFPGQRAAATPAAVALRDE
jgi:ABC-type lipoprotein release transport system permease subunit